MKKHCFLFAMLCLAAMMLLTACTQKFPGYKESPNGLYYKFYSQNPSAVQPKLTDYMRLQMACYLNDSLYYDFQESGMPCSPSSGSRFSPATSRKAMP